jgi:hypothetical protein
LVWFGLVWFGLFVAPFLALASVACSGLPLVLPVGPLPKSGPVDNRMLARLRCTNTDHTVFRDTIRNGPRSVLPRFLSFFPWFGLVLFGLVGFSLNASLGPQRRARKGGRLAEAALFDHTAIFPHTAVFVWPYENGRFIVKIHTSTGRAVLVRHTKTGMIRPFRVVFLVWPHENGPDTTVSYGRSSVAIQTGPLAGRCQSWKFGSFGSEA